MVIYFTRHGETEWNSKNIICGVTDVALSDNGRAQACELAYRLSEGTYGITSIISSPMQRARETAGIISDAVGIPIVSDTRLTEWDYGSFEGMPRDTVGFQDAKLSFGCRMKGGGESVFDLVNRVYGFLDELICSPARGNVLLVSHGGVCRVIESYYRDMTAEDFAGFFMGNCELRSFDPMSADFRRYENSSLPEGDIFGKDSEQAI